MTGDADADEDATSEPSRLLEIYADLYPSIRARLRAIGDSPDPKIRAKLELVERMARRRGGTREAELIQRFDLTRSEARLTAWLSDGGSVTGYAARHGISPATVRTHLKAVFAKTGVHRQAQLASLILAPRRFGPL